jgi:hypothetical protein
MKQGSTLEALAAEVQRQQDSKQDYLADTRQLTLASTTVGAGKDVMLRSTMAIEGVGELGVNDWAHGQVADRLGIPRKFYGRLRSSHTGLLDHNVNTLWREAPEQRMVRTMDGSVRALVSDRYRRLDNHDLCEAALPILMGMEGAQVISCNLSDTRMYLKVLLPMQREVVPGLGDIVQAGVCISNSEVGDGALAVRPLVYRLVCLNGMISLDNMLRAHHIGGRLQEGEHTYAVYSDATLQADDRAFWLKVQDVVRAATDEAIFAKTVDQMNKLATTTPEVQNPVAAVQRIGKQLGLLQGEQESVLAHLASGGNMTQWGMLNAITRTSQDVADYDRATDLEAMGGAVLRMPQTEWQAIARLQRELQDAEAPAEVPLAAVALA